MSTQNTTLRITAEVEGDFFTIQGRNLINILANSLAISNSAADFINKVTYQVTDETSELCQADRENLRTWYNEMNSLIK